MKVITLISGGDVGGAKTHVLSLISGISSSVEVKLVCFREGEFSEEARRLGIPIIVMNSNAVSCFFRLKKMIRAEGFDIIHCHGSRGNMMGMLLKWALDIPVVTTIHSDNRLDYLGRPFGKLVYGNVNKLALRVIKYHIGVSDAMTDTLIGRGYKPYGMFTIYNGLDFSAPLPDAARDDFLKSLGADFPPDSVIVGIAARLDPVKDAATLISAFALAQKRAPKLRLIVAGQGPQYEQLVKLAGTLGISDKICFADWVSDMDGFYGSIDINALTSLSETFPYALTEGARFRLATVSSRVGGVPMLIDHGLNGFMFEPGDAETLAEQLINLALDPKLRGELGQRLFEKADRDFSLKNTCETQVEIYESILRREARASKRRDGVVVCGAYGRHNAGDDAILEAILLELREIDPDMPVWVMTRRTRETAVRYRANTIYTFSVLKFLRRMSKSRLYINGGGSLIQDITSRRSLWFYLFTIRGAKKRGSRVLMYGCGFGPVTREFNRKLSVKVINRYVDIITLREDNSMQEMTEMGICRPKIILSADPSLTLPAAAPDRVDSALVRSGVPLDGNYICFTLRKWQGFSQKLKDFALAADYAYEKHGLTPLFLPIEPKADAAAARMVAEKMTSPYYLLDEAESSSVTIGILSRMKVSVSMRLHGLVFAASQGVPVIGVVYDHKVSAFLKYIGQDMFMDLDSVCADTLCGFIDDAVRISENKDEILKAVQRLRELEKRNSDAARELLAEFSTI